MKWLTIFKKLNLFKKKKAKVPKQPIEEEDPKEAINFTTQVTKKVIQESVDNNKSVICSPVSIDAVLSILAVGAKDSTLEQLLQCLGHDDVRQLNAAACKLAEVLKSSDDDDATVMVSSVNALWLDQRFPLNAVFLKVLRDVHNADAKALDFVNQADQVVKEVNSWVELETRGLIKQILTEVVINAYTRVLLTTALHFKGTWECSFYTQHTKDGDFNLVNGNKFRVPFMNQFHEYFDHGTFEGCQVLRMPYKTGNSAKRFSMYIFLPNEKNGLLNLIKNIKFDENLFKDQVKLNNVKITQLSIPKFKLESYVSLRETMQQLGLTLPFEENCKDFSGIIDAPEPLYISDIFQKCCVETDEQGTKPAAVTWTAVVECSYTELPSPTINFVADHPFVFMIREDVSGVLLFVGSMLVPK